MFKKLPYGAINTVAVSAVAVVLLSASAMGLTPPSSLMWWWCGADNDENRLLCEFDAEIGMFKVSYSGEMNDYNLECDPDDDYCDELTPWHTPRRGENPDNIIRDEITNVIIVDGVTRVGDYAFYDLPNVTTVTIAASVTRIGAGAFNGLPNLTSITSLNPVPPQIEGEVACEPCHPADWCPSCPLPSFSMFPSVDGACLYVPEESVDAYKADYLWSIAFSCIEPLSTNSVRPRATVTHNANARMTVRNRTLHVRGSSPESISRIRLIDMRGKSVASFTARGTSSFSLGNIPAGRYFVEVREGAKMERGSVVVGVR